MRKVAALPSVKKQVGNTYSPPIVAPSSVQVSRSARSPSSLYIEARFCICNRPVNVYGNPSEVKDITLIYSQMIYSQSRDNKHASKESRGL